MTNFHTSTFRKPAVAGLFYPSDALRLSNDLKQFMTDAHLHKLSPKALIVPHAGYVYSGAIAATAYATLIARRDVIRRVILLGPAHRVAVRGLALPGADYFDTPLGSIVVDKDAIHSIADLPQITISPEAHALEHALEVQLPFLQYVLADFNVLPLIVGAASAQEVAEVLDAVWGGDETLIVISSDLSHYLPYAKARQVDHATVQSILQLEQSVTHDQACGGTPINGLILAAQRHHLKPVLLDLRNSGDTVGRRDQVVGYAAIAFCEQ